MFDQGGDILRAETLVRHLVHHLFYEVQSQSANLPVIQREIRLGRDATKRIEWTPVVSNTHNESIPFQRNGHVDDVLLFVIKCVGDDVVEQFVEDQVDPPPVALRYSLSAGKIVEVLVDPTDLLRPVCDLQVEVTDLAAR